MNLYGKTPEAITTTEYGNTFRAIINLEITQIPVDLDAVLFYLFNVAKIFNPRGTKKSNVTSQIRRRCPIT